MKTTKLPKAGLLLAACAGALAATAQATDTYPFKYQVDRDMWNAPLQAATDVAIYAPMYSSLNYAFVADAATTSVTRYVLNGAGNKVGVNGTPYTFSTFGDVIEAIAVNDIPGSPNQGQVYVAEGAADGSWALINVFDLNGNLLVCGSPVAPYAFTRIVGMEVDRDGELYVADQGTMMTMKFDQSDFYARDVCVLMTPVTTYPTKYESPVDVAVSTCGKLVFEPDTCNCFWAFNNDGSDLWPGGPIIPYVTGVDAHDADEQVWISVGSSTVSRYALVDCTFTIPVPVVEASTSATGGGALTSPGRMEFRRFFEFPNLFGKSVCHERLFVCDGKRVAVFSQDHASNEHPADMVAWWKFNDMVNGTAVDSINGNDGTFPYSSAPCQLEGLVDGGFEFTEDDDGVEVPDSTTINMGTSDFTVECWLKSCDEEGVADLLDKRDMNGTSAVAGYSMYLYNGKLSFQLAAGGVWRNWGSTADVTDCQWHHCAAVVSRAKSKLTLFVDGQPTDIDKKLLPPWLGPSVSIDNGSSLLLGRHPVLSPWDDFEGCLDEVTLYKRALHPSEIHQLFNAGCAGKAQ